MKTSVKIISVLCMLAMLIGILPVMSVSASGAALTVTPSASTVKAGNEFTVTVALENNPGFGALAFVMPVDENVFEFVSASTTGSICGQFGICQYDETEKEYKFNGLTANPLANITDNGTLVTVTLKAKADAVLGTYAIVANVDAKNTTDCFEGLVAVADGSANVNVIENKAVSTIDAADVKLGDDISIKYFATLDPTHVGAQMKFTMNGKETVVDGVAGEGENEYVYVFEGVAPQCMGDNIKAELVFEGTTVAVKDNYSVLSYCKNMLASNAAELGITQTKFDAMKTLIADLLEYGAKAQLYKGYKTNALVNAGIEGKTEFTELTKTVKRAWETIYFDDVKFVAAGVYFDYTNALFVKFTAPGMTDEDIRVNFNNDTYYSLSDCELIDEATSTYLLKLDNVSVLDYGSSFNIYLEWYDAEDLEDWDQQQRFRYSVNSYVYSMQGSENTAMADLAKALYNYGASAVAYSEAE